MRTFLREQIDSFEKLEVLLLLAASAGVDWSVYSVAAKLGMPSSLAIATLEELRSLGLIDLRPERRYAYTGPVLQVIQQLAVLYDQDRVGIVKLLNSTALSRIRSSAARAFAEAFRIRPARSGTGDQDA